MPDTSLLTHKTDAMRMILKTVAHGYSRWTGGTVPRVKAEAFALKMIDRYRVDADAQTRWRRKARGEANVRLVLHGAKDDQVVTWWLLVSPGHGVVEQMEKLRDVRRDRIDVTGYELVQTPRKGKPEQWTWRMTPATLEAWHERIKTAIRSKSAEAVAQAIHTLKRTPGFHAARQQAFGLIKFGQDEWKRTRSAGEECPFDGLGLKWVGRYTKGETAPVAPRRRKA